MWRICKDREGTVVGVMAVKVGTVAGITVEKLRITVNVGVYGGESKWV